MTVKELGEQIQTLKNIGVETKLAPVTAIFVKNPETGAQFAIDIAQEAEAKPGIVTIADFTGFQVISVQTNGDGSASAIQVYGKLIPVVEDRKQGS